MWCCFNYCIAELFVHIVYSVKPPIARNLQIQIKKQQLIYEKKYISF